MGCSTRGFPVFHHLPELAQTHVPWVTDAIPTISSSAVPFSSCLLSFPASGSFPISQLFASGGQSIGASASASVLAMNIHNWFPLGLTGSISLQSNELSRVFSRTTFQKWLYQFTFSQTMYKRSLFCTLSLTLDISYLSSLFLVVHHLCCSGMTLTWASSNYSISNSLF